MGEQEIKSAQGSIYEDRLTGWAKFIAIMNIIGGSLTCLNILTVFIKRTAFEIVFTFVPVLLIGIPYIFIGIKLLSAAKNFGLFTSERDDARHSQAMKDLNTYFMINGILAIILTVISILFVAAIVLFAVRGLGGGLPMRY